MITVACALMLFGVLLCALLQDAKHGFKFIAFGLIVLACKVLP